MRTVTKTAAEAFMSGNRCSIGNTVVSVEQDGSVSLLLHGNVIAKRYIDGKKEIEVSNAGWFSRVTKERLNGLPGVDVVQRKGLWYLNGKEWDGSWTQV